MKFIPTPVADVFLIEPEVLEDARGFFYESYRKDLFAANGIRTEFVQDNHSQSHKGVLRGLHYQVQPKAQAKLISVIKGSVFDVCVDIRKGSKTFGKYTSVVLSAENKKMIYVPEGFAHGFLVLEDHTEFLYKVSDFHSPAHEKGIIWNDAAVKIDWPNIGMDYILSDKDKKHPTLKEMSS